MEAPRGGSQPVRLVPRVALLGGRAEPAGRSRSPTRPPATSPDARAGGPAGSIPHPSTGWQGRAIAGLPAGGEEGRGDGSRAEEPDLSGLPGSLAWEARSAVTVWG